MIKCPNNQCGQNINPIVLFQNNGSDNIDNLPHQDLKCPLCGRRFNHWICEKEKIQQAFGHLTHLFANE